MQDRPTRVVVKKKQSIKPANLQIGDVVKVRQGFKDPDTKVDMGNWHGRITQLDHSISRLICQSVG